MVTRDEAVQLLALEVVLQRALEALVDDPGDRAAETELRQVVSQMSRLLTD